MRLTYYTKGLDDDTGDGVAIKLEYNPMEFPALRNEFPLYKTFAEPD